MPMNHLGFMRPKSVRIGVRNLRLGSSTTGPLGPRRKTTQCQNARSRSLCHLMASSARSGRASHEVKGTSVLADLIPYQNIVSYLLRRSNCEYTKPK